MPKVPIYICSSRRAVKAAALVRICVATGHPVYLVVPEAEIPSYLVTMPGSVVYIPQKSGRLPEANQLAFRHGAFNHGARAMIMIDDDARFRHRHIEKGLLTDMGTEGHAQMFRDLTEFPPGVPLQGVQQYFMHQQKTGAFQECCAQGTLQAIDLCNLNPTGFRFDRVPTYQDTDFVLQVAEACFSNRLLNQYVVSTSDSWSGGCDYRKVSTWNDAITKLVELHGPTLIKTRMKLVRRKRVLRSVSKTCTEVNMLTLTVAWKKAFEC